jgi:hypothetical protein
MATAVCDGGAWDGGARDDDGGSLPPKLSLCNRPPSSSLDREWRRTGAVRALYSPGPLVPVGNTSRD